MAGPDGSLACAGCGKPLNTDIGSFVEYEMAPGVFIDLCTGRSQYDASVSCLRQALLDRSVCPGCGNAPSGPLRSRHSICLGCRANIGRGRAALEQDGIDFQVIDIHPPLPATREAAGFDAFDRLAVALSAALSPSGQPRPTQRATSVVAYVTKEQAAAVEALLREVDQIVSGVRASSLKEGANLLARLGAGEMTLTHFEKELDR